MRLIHCIAMLGLGLAAVPAHAKVLTLSSASASSTEPGTDDVSYDAKNLSDARQSTVWVEGDPGSGLGAWVQVDLAEPSMVTSVRLWNGNWYTHDFWERHNRIKDVELEFSDGTKHTVELKDEMVPELIKLPKAVKTSWVKVKIKGIHRGNTFNDTCLSEVQLIDDTPPESVPVAAYSASSVYPPDTDGDYEPINMSDHLMDSMWCEGNKDGDGTGEWVEFDFGSSHTVSKLRVVNGNGYSFAFNMKANKVRTATLSFSDGSTESISLKPSYKMQDVSFAPHDTSKVRITFDTIMKGKDFNDLCISEAAFVE